MTDDTYTLAKAAADYLSSFVFNESSHKLPLVAVPDSVRLEETEKYEQTPRRIKSNYTFKDVESFISYYREHDRDTTRLFYKDDEHGLAIKAVFDHHTRGHLPAPEGQESVAVDEPRWGSHTAVFKLAYHEEYKRLLAANGRGFTQLDFAEFVEDNLPLFGSPDGATMLEIAQELKGARKADFRAGTRLADGRVNFEYVEEVSAKTIRGEVKIPEDITFICSIYEGEAAVHIPAKFRWRLSDSGKVSFQYKLMTDRIERNARAQVIASVSALANRNILQLA